MDPWKIIGWGLLFLFVGWPILRWLISSLCGVIIYIAQRRERRERLVERYDSYRSIWGGSTYRVNNVFGDMLVVSSDPNNLGGFHISRPAWAEQVRRGKLVRIP